MERERILDLQFLFLEFCNSRGIRCWAAGFFFDHAIESGMSGLKAVSKAGFHQRLSIVDCEAE